MRQDGTAETAQAGNGARPPIPDQRDVPWSVAFRVSLAGVRRRLLRALLAMAGVVLAIAFLCYMLVTGDVIEALVAADVPEINVLLARAGVDIQAAGRRDPMMLLLMGLSLFTCLVGIVNAMLMAVTERIKEIGTLKCLGALDGFIVKTFFIESALQGMIGTLLGMFAGLAVAVAVMLVSYGGHAARLFPWGAALRSLGLAFLVGAVLSVLAAIAPAYWAARKEPVEAMRVEE
jgi:putative ABC transport system permease protein